VTVPVGTPLAAGEELDEQGLRRLVRHVIAGGIHGILANGSMGGFAWLTDEARLRSIRVVVEEVNGAVPVLGGLGETGTRRAVQMARRIAAEGVQYLSVLAPFYFLANQEHLYAYFSEIASAVDLPIFLYDNPVLTKCPIAPETVAHLRQRIPNIVGIKESKEDCVNMQQLLYLMKDDSGFSILSGSEFLILTHLQMGCDGCVGGLHNVCPHLAVGLYKAFLAGDLARARKLQRDLIDAWQIFRYGNIWGAFDEALRYLGICQCATAAPYVKELTGEERAKVHAILDRIVPKESL
jgi:4-hydroxy-tetrahydrodipicolinate synthase